MRSIVVQQRAYAEHFNISAPRTIDLVPQQMIDAGI